MSLCGNGVGFYGEAAFVADVLCNACFNACRLGNNLFGNACMLAFACACFLFAANTAYAFFNTVACFGSLCGYDPITEAVTLCGKNIFLYVCIANGTYII